MMIQSLSFRFAFAISVSFAAASYTTTTTAYSPNFFSVKSQLSPTTPPAPKATPSDLLSLLGSPLQASSVNPIVAKELRSCFKFLVPFSPSQLGSEVETTLSRRALSSKSSCANGNRRRNVENELVWWPPAPVMELARLAVDSGGDPDAISRTLDPTMIPVPDVEECDENSCQLTRTPYGRHFISKELNTYLSYLFEVIVARGPSVGLNVSLSRFDLFHGHIFLATDSGRLGILYKPSIEPPPIKMDYTVLETVHVDVICNIPLHQDEKHSRLIRFHAKEYPMYDKKVFPHNMGYCQKGSNVAYDELMNLRNILWLAPMPSSSADAWSAPGVLVVLDARPDGIIYRDIIPEYVDYVRTIYEDDLGDVVADVNYLNVGGAVPDYQIFIC